MVTPSQPMPRYSARLKNSSSPPCAQRCAQILTEIERVIVGKRVAVAQVLLGILASGHILIEDLPGLGKTLLARSFATALGLEFTRVQFTPDMLPADLTGAPVLDPRTGDVVFRPGPVFTNLLLGDEINRTPPKTQAALLEAMGEGQVSIDGHTHLLPQPFVVLATDNPIEYEGTYPLPEAQLDRFTARIRLGYLDEAGEVEMARRRLARGSTPPQPEQILDADTLLAMRESLEQVHLDDDLLGYIVRLVAATDSLAGHSWIQRSKKRQSSDRSPQNEQNRCYPYRQHGARFQIKRI